jgi:hypothetical protein
MGSLTVRPGVRSALVRCGRRAATAFAGCMEALREPPIARRADSQSHGVGNFVANPEEIDGFNAPGGLNSVQAIAGYQVNGGKISRTAMYVLRSDRTCIREVETSPSPDCTTSCVASLVTPVRCRTISPATSR